MVSRASWNADAQAVLLLLLPKLQGLQPSFLGRVRLWAKNFNRERLQKRQNISDFKNRAPSCVRQSGTFRNEHTNCKRTSGKNNGRLALLVHRRHRPHSKKAPKFRRDKPRDREEPFCAEHSKEHCKRKRHSRQRQSSFRQAHQRHIPCVHLRQQRQVFSDHRAIKRQLRMSHHSMQNIRIYCRILQRRI